MTLRAARRMAAALLPFALAGTGAPALAAPPEPPLSVSVRLLSGDAARGRYRVEVRLRAQAPLEDAVMVLKVAPRGPGAGAARSGRAQAREAREPVSLRPGLELRREMDVLTGAQEPVTLLVGLGGRMDGAQVHRTRALELGPELPADTAARARTDQFGRTYLEVPLQAPR